MKCQECGKEATVHVTDLAGGQPRTRHFCGDHEEKHTIGDGSRLVSFDVTDVEIEKGEVHIPLLSGPKLQYAIPTETKVGDRIVVVLGADELKGDEGGPAPGP